MKQFAFFIILFFISSTSDAKQRPVSWKKIKILVYTKNGKGYVHDNIPYAVKAIQKLGTEKGFKVDVSDDPSVFTERNLKQYNFLLFTSTNNDVFDTEAQRLAFRRYIEAGGGLVGLHSVVGTERNWKWFKTMIGGTFVWHPKFQTIRLKIVDKEHSTVSSLPDSWTKEDECYFMKEMYPGVRVVLVHDLNSLNTEEQEKIKHFAGPFTDYYPAAWYHHFDGGTVWITALGHDKKDYDDPVYLKHIFQGMEFVARHTRGIDYSRSYATTFEQDLRD